MWLGRIASSAQNATTCPVFRVTMVLFDMTWKRPVSIWQSREFDQHEHVSYFTDARSGLRAIISIHITARGPAVGGKRFWPYKEDHLALEDALRLSRAMSYKCALADLPLGGGKAVIMVNPAQ